MQYLIITCIYACWLVCTEQSFTIYIFTIYIFTIYILLYVRESIHTRKQHIGKEGKRREIVKHETIQHAGELGGVH